jgi:hypothetical protein
LRHGNRGSAITPAAGYGLTGRESFTARPFIVSAAPCSGSRRPSRMVGRSSLSLNKLRLMMAAGPACCPGLVGMRQLISAPVGAPRRGRSR